MRFSRLKHFLGSGVDNRTELYLLTVISSLKAYFTLACDNTKKCVTLCIHTPSVYAHFILVHLENCQGERNWHSTLRLQLSKQLLTTVWNESLANPIFATSSWTQLFCLLVILILSLLSTWMHSLNCSFIYYCRLLTITFFPLSLC